MGHALATQGPGTGALGLPGDFTSPSRFVRTTFLKNYAAPTHNVADSLNLLQHILNSVTIPKGVKLKENGQSDYTEYRGYMSLDERAYYMEPYDNLVLQRVALTDDLLAHLDAPREYPISHQVHIQDLAPDTVTD
ncbi:linear amide C-N hydrolase [Levilactobacillus zymae]|uniref:linear amide C-N hydrolase n=1 Tax=Levilactobacillus zymae TaxID=267363 RepID=UPI001E4406D1|nr:linear amide C-N hydrolase [Levilactobacillus zymae]